MTAIRTQTERKRQVRSVRQAGKRRCQAKTQRLPDLIRPVPATRVTVEAAWREKGLSLSHIQAIFHIKRNATWRLSE